MLWNPYGQIVDTTPLALASIMSRGGGLSNQRIPRVPGIADRYLQYLDEAMGTAGRLMHGGIDRPEERDVFRTLTDLYRGLPGPVTPTEGMGLGREAAGITRGATAAVPGVIGPGQQLAARGADITSGAADIARRAGGAPLPEQLNLLRSRLAPEFVSTSPAFSKFTAATEPVFQRDLSRALAAVNASLAPRLKGNVDTGQADILGRTAEPIIERRNAQIAEAALRDLNQRMAEQGQAMESRLPLVGGEQAREQARLVGSLGGELGGLGTALANIGLAGGAAQRAGAGQLMEAGQQAGGFAETPFRTGLEAARTGAGITGQYGDVAARAAERNLQGALAGAHLAAGTPGTHDLYVPGSSFLEQMANMQTGAGGGMTNPVQNYLNYLAGGGALGQLRRGGQGPGGGGDFGGIGGGVWNEPWWRGGNPYQTRTDVGPGRFGPGAPPIAGRGATSATGAGGGASAVGSGGEVGGVGAGGVRTPNFPPYPTGAGGGTGTVIPPIGTGGGNAGTVRPPWPGSAGGEYPAQGRPDLTNATFDPDTGTWVLPGGQGFYDPTSGHIRPPRTGAQDEPFANVGPPPDTIYGRPIPGRPGEQESRQESYEAPPGGVTSEYSWDPVTNVPVLSAPNIFGRSPLEGMRPLGGIPGMMGPGGAPFSTTVSAGDNAPASGFYRQPPGSPIGTPWITPSGTMPSPLGTEPGRGSGNPTDMRLLDPNYTPPERSPWEDTSGRDPTNPLNYSDVGGVSSERYARFGPAPPGGWPSSGGGGTTPFVSPGGGAGGGGYGGGVAGWVSPLGPAMSQGRLLPKPEPPTGKTDAAGNVYPWDTGGQATAPATRPFTVGGQSPAVQTYSSQRQTQPTTPFGGGEMSPYRMPRTTATNVFGNMGQMASNAWQNLAGRFPRPKRRMEMERGTAAF